MASDVKHSCSIIIAQTQHGGIVWVGNSYHSSDVPGCRTHI